MKPTEEQINKSYDFMANVFIKQAPRIPSFEEIYGDGSIHGFNKEMAAKMYEIIIKIIEEDFK